ncbi:MAG: ArdC family protein [Lachnospiraceae bacterium]
MARAFDIVMESRKELVGKIIKMMEDGYHFTSPIWNHAALCPNNPISNVRYRGGNKLRLINAVLENGYKDPRWFTQKQLKKEGYSTKPGERGVLCEKWIFFKDVKVKNEIGEIIKKKEELEKPIASFFTVYNAEQTVVFPKLEISEPDQTEVNHIAEKFKSVSECPIIETGQPEAFYAPASDKIYIPLKGAFKDPESYYKTIFHEMSHSTGHNTRLNRDLSGSFGSEKYAKEELRAEIGAMFIEADLGIHMSGEHFQDHSNYLLSWIKVLKDDPNELFRACADAEKISERLVDNYYKYQKNDISKGAESINSCEKENTYPCLSV